MQSVDVVKYTDEEYKKHLTDPVVLWMWSKEETDQLFDFCERFDLRFIIIADRFPYPRTVEELKNRYYSGTSFFMHGYLEYGEENIVMNMKICDHLQSAEDVELPVNQIGNEGSEATAHAESVSLLNTNHLASSTVAPPTAECTSTPASLRMVDPIFSLFIQLC
ncbi:hypothetical protein BHM03_00016423, partial [Ensete ventricosum]